MWEKEIYNFCVATSGEREARFEKKGKLIIWF